MLTAKVVKEYCRAAGADLVGIAPMERFAGAPKERDPRYIFPDAQAMVVLWNLGESMFINIENNVVPPITDRMRANLESIFEGLADRLL